MASNNIFPQYRALICHSLNPGGLLLADNIDVTTSFYDFSREQRRNVTMLSGGTGIIIR